MKPALTALAGAAALLLPPVAAAADGAHATFGSARLKDDLRGALVDTTPDVVRFRALGKGKLSLTLAPDTAESATAAAGLSLVLRNGAGTDQGVAGGPFDKSKGDGRVVWKNVPLETADTWDLEVAAATPGGWRLTLAGTQPAVVTNAVVEDLSPQEEGEFVVEGLARAKLQVALSAAGGTKFQGEVVRIVQPDGSDLAAVPEKKNVTVTLAQDGPHRVVFRNVSSRLGDAKCKATVTASVKTRTGYVRAAGTALVPKVKKVVPPSGFHRDAAFALTLTGSDFQPGLDVRLLRNGRDDILGTGIEFVSESEVRCVLDLDTGDTTGLTSVGTWKVGVWNAPEYGVPDDRSTLVKDRPTADQKKTFEALSNGSIRLPDGVEEGTEVWYVKFNSDFQTDLNRMGFGPADDDPDVRKAAREAVQAYVILFLRDLFRADETDGKVKAKSVPVCFLVDQPSATVGNAGEDYNLIEVGGKQEAADEHDPDEPLAWGFTPADPGNARRENLTVLDEDGVTRLGRGVRLRFLDPTEPGVAASWIAATLPLRNAPLTEFDLRYYTPGFQPANQGQANRYRDVVEQTTRAAREIAAVIAHHVGKAMGLPDGGNGPMANPATAGDFWPTTTALFFADADVFSLQAAAVPHELPGNTRRLTIGYFPLRTTQAFRLTPNCETGKPYATTWNLVGGRPNASLADYRAFYGSGSEVPRGLTLSVAGLSGTAPPMFATNVPYCDDVRMRILFEDKKTSNATLFQWGLKVLPDENYSGIPSALVPNARICREQLLAIQ